MEYQPKFKARVLFPLEEETKQIWASNIFFSISWFWTRSRGEEKLFRIYSKYSSPSGLRIFFCIKKCHHFLFPSTYTLYIPWHCYVCNGTYTVFCIRICIYFVVYFFSFPLRLLLRDTWARKRRGMSWKKWRKWGFELYFYFIFGWNRAKYTMIVRICMRIR